MAAHLQAAQAASVPSQSDDMQSFSSDPIPNHQQTPPPVPHGTPTVSHTSPPVPQGTLSTSSTQPADEDKLGRFGYVKHVLREIVV